MEASKSRRRSRRYGPILDANRIAVIGSGPAGVSCAKALARRGIKVVLFDGGQTLDADRVALAGRLAKAEPAQWAEDDVAKLSENHTVIGKGLPKKLVFGSDYIYSRGHPALPIAGNVEATSSLAQGGFSMAWGGAMLPVSDDDIMDWPLSRSDLQPAYSRVLAGMPFSAVKDELASDFPLYGEPQGQLRLPRQVEDLMADLRRSQGGRASRGDRLNFGQSRLAVRTVSDEQGKSCSYCGYCLASCPYGSIYTFDRELQVLVQNGSVDYRPGVLASRFQEDGDAVRLWTMDGKGEATGTFDFARLFVAAGALNTTRMTLGSLGHYGRPVRFHDSQKFAIPIVRLQRRSLEWPNINSLASLFVEAQFPSVSPYWIHMQVSAINDMVLQRLGITDRKGMRSRLLAPGVERLMVAWCSLHSKLSDGFAAGLYPDGNGSLEEGQGTLHLIRVESADAARVTRQFLRRLAYRGLGFRSLILPLPTKSPLAGTSHFGGSFPMRRTPKDFNDTDLLGRPAGLSRVHLVDGSVLPTIPATTIMLQIMANADRIATDVDIV